MNYTDEQLKAALAKMLPETCYMNEGGGTLYYQPDKLTICYSIHPSRVLDTELMHLCWLVEETLNSTALLRSDYIGCLSVDIAGWEYGFTHASWQQRVIALAKVKGIEI